MASITKSSTIPFRPMFRDPSFERKSCGIRKAIARHVNHAAVGERRIVVAVDDTEVSEKACDFAIKNIAKPGDVFHVLHVIPFQDTRTYYGTISYVPPVAEEMLKELRKAAETLLLRYADKFNTANISCECDLIEENSWETIAEVICNTTESLDATCLLIASHGKNPMQELLLGSVSNYCTHHCKKPVLIIH